MTTANLDPEIIQTALTQIQPLIEQVANKLWDLAEVSLQEVESVKYLVGVLTDQGFTITSTGTSGVPTAFTAEWGSGGPVLGILLEYDALPGLGNEPVTCKQARKDGTTSGHGCGHNLIGAAALGAAVALKNVMAAQKVPGTIRVFGCAAEETEGAKVYMARDGLFNDLDAALHCHPFEFPGVAHVCTSAQNQMRVEFFGRTAHAGASPWLGRSSVHAAELFTHAVNLMREHVEPTARIHYVYESAGMAPNIVPDYAKLWLIVRDADRTRVNASTQWLKEAADGAAMATQTQAKLDVFYGMYDLLPNTALSKNMQAHLDRIGSPKWTEDEQQFARELQKSFGAEAKGLAKNVVPLLLDEPKMGGSTDVGDVSWCTPTTGIAMPSVPMGVSLHTWAATATHGMSIGLKACMSMSRLLAATGADIMTDAELREAAKAEFKRRTNGAVYECPVPDSRTTPFSLPDWMTQDACREMFSGLKSHDH